MAKFKINGPDGQSFILNAPDDATPEQVQAAAAQQIAAMQKAAPAAQPVPTGASAGRGGIAGGVVMGLRDPIDAGAQLLARGVDAAVGGLNRVTGLNLPRPDVANVDRIVNEANAEYDASRKMAGREGIDVARIGGNVANPVNLAGGRLVAGANTLRQLAARGAAAGAIGGAAQPVIGEPQQADFLGNKALQAGAGAIGGAVLTPAIAKASTSLAQGVQSLGRRFVGARDADVQAQAARMVDDWAASLQQTAGADLADVPASIRANVQAKVAEALRSGRQFDPAAIARAEEFAAVGITPTRGQITRDPVQFARERNLRGVEGAGEPLTQRFQEQNNRLLQLLNQRAAGALEPDEAGNALMQSLRAIDEPVQRRVGQAYQAARDSSGRAAAVDVPGFSNAANDALDSQMLGRFLPESVRGLLNDISAGNIPLNVNNLVQVDSVLSQAQRAAAREPAVQRAIGVVRDALNNADIEGAAGQQAKGAFDKARGMARARFKAIEETPGLRAALDDETPDAFVRKYLIGGYVKSVNNLMRTLGGDEDAATLARSQVAAYLRDKAFPVNAAGDGSFSQAGFNRAIAAIGKNKLRAIFGDEGAEQLQQIGRVAAYMKAQPGEATVNNSNTAAAVMNLLSDVSGSVGGFGSLPLVNIARNTFRNYGNERFARDALSGQVPQQAAELPPEMRNALMRYLAAPAAVSAGSMAGALGQ
jgi:hypothetical protein